MSKPHHSCRRLIDHHEARVFHGGPADIERIILRPDHPTRHIHHRANSIGSGHASEDQNYFHAVAESIADARAVLIAGPANAKIELVKHIHPRYPKLANVIAGVETVDHPSDAQLVACARKYLKATDRCSTPQPFRKGKRFDNRPEGRLGLIFTQRSKRSRNSAMRRALQTYFIRKRAFLSPKRASRAGVVAA